MIAKVAFSSLLASAYAQQPSSELYGGGTESGGEWVQKLHKTPMVAATGTCASHKALYKEQKCCGSPEKQTGLQSIPLGMAGQGVKAGINICAGTKVELPNVGCTDAEGILAVFEQSGTNVTKDYVGGMDVSNAVPGDTNGVQLGRLGSNVPITTNYFEAGLCPVNVHWHLGAEHLSVGQYDSTGTGPDGALVFEDASGNTRRLSDFPTSGTERGGESRRLAAYARLGFRCKHYDPNLPGFSTPYTWHHCTDMEVGETYEVHWPHSKLGACGTPNQYQSPFYDGVFCHSSKLTDTAKDIGVQGQVFTIINDENYYYPDLFRGMIIDGAHGQDMAVYTGSTTGTSRNNNVCSQYTPITWQVDRTCHLISASSFDKMCADMKAQRDDMTMDLYPHGARELVSNKLAANNLVDAAGIR